MNKIMSKPKNELHGEYVSLNGESYFRIANQHLMPDFFMSITGASDHWMFISSRGALTAGRRNSDFSLFQYTSDDQISAQRSSTGPLTLIKASRGLSNSNNPMIWEPFSDVKPEEEESPTHIYKTPLGNKVVFEQVHEELELSYRYRWAFSEKFGFVRSCELTNVGDSPIDIEILDGLQNVLPYGVGREFQMRFSNLGNAYKKNELLEESRLGIYYLSSIPTDKAEPSEGLLATTVWQSGLDPETTLLGTDQVAAFCRGAELVTDLDQRGKAGAYLQTATMRLDPGASKKWLVVAELNQSHGDIVDLNHWLLNSRDIEQEVESDIQQCEAELVKIVGSADGLQLSGNRRRTNRHLSNTIFNVMRGGVPFSNYEFPSQDFAKVVRQFNLPVYQRHLEFLKGLPETVDVQTLKELVAPQNDIDLTRLANEYLPLTFGRRHGDPTRPWNHFSIDIKNEDGETHLSYQGNWRDIFQNWEAIGVSFPQLLPAMVCRFVNATTADGYNPYRITKEGIEWEEPSPEDPWANIGYWGDHQIIYLLKLLEWTKDSHPELLDQMLTRHEFTHANVPYRITTFEQIKQDPQSTIDFDQELANEIASEFEKIGSDAKLLRDKQGEIVYVSLFEKLLTLSLAKISNLVPDGGIWLNTQRPEWNDANNALVGNGLSMVTTCYLYRWFAFLRDLIRSKANGYVVSPNLFRHYQEIKSALSQFEAQLDQGFTADTRDQLVAMLSTSGSDYRQQLYENGIGAEDSVIESAEFEQFCDLVLAHLGQTIRNNRRDDGLYHTYNLIEIGEGQVEVRHLYEMLEGQVAVLSSGILSAHEVVELLNNLRQSRLYRENQHSYLLYPDRDLPRFMDKNSIDQEDVDDNELLLKLLEANDKSVIAQDSDGNVRFHGKLKNSADLKNALGRLTGELGELAKNRIEQTCELFERVFNHTEFTGRSGTFFAYEGLGSIYWHMVSKLGLAVCENLFWAQRRNESAEVIKALRFHFDEIRSGIGAEKSPDEYGAFPTDPYSHTPENAGVKQPGMTGQVKEDVLSRLAELGVAIDQGCLSFQMGLFDENEFLTQPATFQFVNVSGETASLELETGSMAYTICQIPVVVKRGQENRLSIETNDGATRQFNDLRLDAETSQNIFSRDGHVVKIECEFTNS